MNFTKEQLKPYIDKVSEEFGEIFNIAPTDLDKGVIFLKMRGYDNFVKIAHILSDKLLMTIMVGFGVLEIDILITSPEEMADYIKQYMPFLEAIRTDDEEDDDEPIQYSVLINEEALDIPTDNCICVDGIYISVTKLGEE